MDNFDRNFNRMAKAVIIGWIVAALVGLGILGVIVWAIIKLVTHFAG